MRSARWALAAAVAAAAAANAVAAQGEGLAPDAATWPRWQGRLSLGSTGPLSRLGMPNADGSGLKVRAAGLLGDYYFARSLRNAGSAGGFRATSGVFLGSRSSSLLWNSQTAALTGRAFNVDRRSLGGLTLNPRDDISAPVPYLGLGYTGIAGKGSWGFSADLGVMALGSGSSVKLGRVFSGNHSLDDASHDMRLSPLLQLGVSYSF
jgi:opacity protein-like surface antigen